MPGCQEVEAEFFPYTPLPEPKVWEADEFLGSFKESWPHGGVWIN